MPETLEIAGRAARAAGPDALARVRQERSLTLRFAAGRPTQGTAVDDLTVELAVVDRGHVGRAATNASDDGELAECAGRARAAARAAAAAGGGSFPGFEPARDGSAAADATTPGPGFWDAETAALDPARGGAELAAAFAAADSAAFEAHGFWTAAEERRAWAGRDNGGEERSTDAFMKLICIAPDGRSGYAARTARASSELDGRALCLEAAAKASAHGEPAELRPGEYDVVFEAHAVGCLLDQLATSAFDGLAHAEGRGAFSERLGSTVAAPAIELVDDPYHPLTLPRSFDAEGTPKRALPLIQAGVARGVTHDTRSAALAGKRSSGHALVPGGDPWGAPPTNLVLAGGEAESIEELCASVERGIYVTRLWYANTIRPKETLATAVTRDGTFLIEDGRIAKPVRDLRMTDRVLGILERVQAVGRGQKLTSDGELYGRRFATGVVCPPLRVAGVRFTGAAG